MHFLHHLASRPPATGSAAHRVCRNRSRPSLLGPERIDERLRREKYSVGGRRRERSTREDHLGPCRVPSENTAPTSTQARGENDLKCIQNLAD